MTGKQHTKTDTAVEPDSAFREESTSVLQANDPELPVAPITAQFPALDGTQEGLHAEVAKRSVDGAHGDVFEKVFAVGRLGVTAGDAIHAANKAGVVQEAVQRGLHPKAEPEFVDSVEHDEPLNASGTRRSQWTELRYRVQVVPSSIDLEPETTVTPTQVTDTSQAN